MEEKKEINKKILSIEDILAKKEAIKERKKPKQCYIYSEFLEGNLLAHSLSKGDLRDLFGGDMEDKEKQARQLVYRSIDDLRNTDLLESFGRKKKNQDMIVEDIFTTAEIQDIGVILVQLNGLASLNENEIMMQTIEELQGE